MNISRIDNGLQRGEKLLTGISWATCILIMFLFVVDIFMRFFFNKPLPATWEISEVCMPIIVFLPFAYTLTRGGHVRVSLVTDRLSPRIRFGFEIISNSISFIICAMLTYWAWGHFWSSFVINEEMLAAIKVPWWVGKMAMPIGMGFFAIRFLIQIIGSLADKRIVSGG
jgi:TRAP-type C4-dicarboxylate transport system permease small subunit